VSYYEISKVTRSDTAVNDVEGVMQSLEYLPGGAYLLVGHPVYVTQEMRDAHLLGQAPGIETVNRDWQRRMFMEDSVLDYCRVHNVIPVSYADV
jgi:hypothetical protein